MQTATLITGASSGIGYEMACQLAAEGRRLVLTARSANTLQEMASRFAAAHGVQVTVIAADLSRPGAAEQIYDTCREQQITVDELINNAGFGDFGFFHESRWNRVEEMIQLNITALTQLCRLFIPDMVAARRGRVMNVASTAGFSPGPMMSVYFATKAYVIHFSEAISNELSGTGVTVTAYCPGATETGFAEASQSANSGLFKNKKLPDAAAVARHAIQSMRQGKRLAIHGWLNALMVFSTRLSPRGAVLKVTRKMMGK